MSTRAITATTATTATTRTTGRRTAHRNGLVALGAAAALLLLLGASPAMAAPAPAPDLHDGDTVYIGGAGVGYGGTELMPVYSATPADPANPGAPTFWAYCIEHDIPHSTHVTARIGDVDSYLGTNYVATDPAVPGKVLWVLAHSYPALSLADFGDASGVPGIDEDDAIEATQYAIWRYTELTFDAAWAWEDADSEAAYYYLIDGANASGGMTPDEVAATVSVTAPAAAQTAGSLVGPFEVHTDQATAAVTTTPSVPLVDANGDPVAAASVVDGQELYLDLRGTTAAGSATLTATITGSSVQGKVLTMAASGSTAAPTALDHGQSLILVAPATTTTSADAAATWGAVAGTGAGTGSGSGPQAGGGSGAASGAADGVQQLAATGPAAPALPGALAILALAAGASLLLARRRRA